MIKVRVSTCDGDKLAPRINDDLISTEEMALKRAEQELASHLKIVTSRGLDMPFDHHIDINQYRYFNFSRLGIHGQHRVVSVKMDFNVPSGEVMMSVDCAQYEDMCGSD